MFDREREVGGEVLRQRMNERLKERRKETEWFRKDIMIIYALEENRARVKEREKMSERKS